MLSKVMSISSLPCNIEAQLCRVNDFYICSKFTEEMIGPRIVLIGGAIYYRFMKYIYLPQPPEKLNSEQVIGVCDLRLDYLDNLVDFKLNNCIMANIANYVPPTFANIYSSVKVLDFGCGSGLSGQLLLKHLPTLEIVGVDISKKAVSHCHKQGLVSFHTCYGEPLPFEPATFDLIIAVFVMQFNIDVPILLELCRVLQPKGQFVFNLYKRDVDEVYRQLYRRDIDGIIRQLQEAGFGSIEIESRLPGMSPNNLIVSCRVFSPHKTFFFEVQQSAKQQIEEGI